jgi:NADPH-dependent 2,4-dienoyl-CoA reductase/sulfur reductase-like enzyme
MISRRSFTKLIGGAGASAFAIGSKAPFAIAQRAPKVVIVGGGAGGATVARHLVRQVPQLDVTLIEAKPIYSSSFFSNLYLGGFRTLESLNHSYVGLQRLGVKVVHDVAVDVDSTRRTVKTREGRTYAYDRLVLSPGIAIKYESVRGYSHEVSRTMPHAYTTNAAGKRTLRRQLQTMRDGGTVVMVVPDNPYRCPPAPYERACMIAHYLKAKKPRSKLVILDPKKTFTKQALFTEAFEKYYKGIVDLNLSTEVDDFSVVRVDPKSRTIFTRAGKRVKADVANVIPQQRAGDIAARAGCTEGDWCPIDPNDFSSRKVRNVHVLGDAAIAADMPKSAFAAHSQAIMVAADILTELAEKEKIAAAYSNTCWSLLAPDDSVKIGANYAPANGRLAASDGFVSQVGEGADMRRRNYRESVDWYDSITADMFAKAHRGADVQKREAPAGGAPGEPG